MAAKVAPGAAQQPGGLGGIGAGLATVVAISVAGFFDSMMIAYEGQAAQQDVVGGVDLSLKVVQKSAHERDHFFG